MEDGRRYYVGQEGEEAAKWKVLEACFVPACAYGLGRLALTGENNWRMVELLNEETPVKVK